MKCLNPRHVNGVTIGCGKCAFCLRKKVDEISFRLTQEGKGKHTYFVTLTYENDPKDGVSLDDVQKLFKRMRKHGSIFRYYCISEYGPHNTHRPHYHFLMFTQQDYDDVARVLLDTWSNGFFTLENVTTARIKYVANYHVTKGYNPQNKNENFCISSKGIGKEFLKRNASMFHEGITYVTDYDGVKHRMPRYYKDKVHFRKDTREKLANQAQKNDLISDENASFLYKELSRLQRWSEKVKEKIIKKKFK